MLTCQHSDGSRWLGDHISIYHDQSDDIIEAMIIGLKNNRRRQSSVEFLKFKEVIF